MKKICVLTAFSVLLAVVFTGCVGTVDGRRNVGVPLIKDRVSQRYPRPPVDLWTAAQDVLKLNGNLYSVDTLKATLEASVADRTVWVRIEPVDQQVTQITVQVRTKAGGGDIQLASELQTQIGIRLATGNLTPATRPATGS